MREFLRRLLPDPERLRAHRWLRWRAPAMQHPRLWRLTRRGVALGVFFGLLIPVAQIPLSAARCCSAWRLCPAPPASPPGCSPPGCGG